MILILFTWLALLTLFAIWTAWKVIDLRSMLWDVWKQLRMDAVEVPVDYDRDWEG